ncbi:MAG: zinc-dependent metalloprotease [Pseudobdellovibrionaceae bacterium]
MNFLKVLAVGFLIFSGCTRVEKIIEVRQASPNIRESFIQSNQKTLALKTSALGKVFMLVANSKTTGSQPKWIEHPIKLVTFERSGAQIGLFEVGYPQIYSSLAAQKILQTFPITSETADQLVINMEKGFTGLNSVQSFESMRPNKNQETLREAGSETSAVVKDLLVKSAEVHDDKVQVTQFSRVQRTVLMSQTRRQKKRNSETPFLAVVEDSFDTRIDLFPYIENKNFTPKEQDPDWNIGMFISRIFQDSSDHLESLTNRWDLTHPVRYVLVGNPPQKAISYIKEGLEYWNRVVGREIVRVEVSDQLDVEPANGTVVVRWISWKDAGSAYAGSQQNPLTGEILRGQIYLPSSWLEPALMGGALGSTESTLGGSNLCEVSASAAKDMEVLAEAVPHGTQQAVLDYLRLVVAHEAGHTLGLRHHFAGTSQVKASFEEIAQAHETYRKDPLQTVTYPDFSLSVMEYLHPLDSAILGHNLMKGVLSYDKAALDWAYNGKDKPSPPVGAFCTDDHLAYANEEAVSVFGCGRFKNIGTPVIAEFGAVNTGDEEAIELDVKTLRDSSISEEGKFKLPPVDQYYQGVAAYRISARSSAIDNFLFSIKNEKDATEVNKILFPQEVTEILLNKGVLRGQTSAKVRDKIAEEFNQIIEAPSRKSLILPVDAQGKIDMNWAQNQLAKINLKKYQKGKTSSGVEYQLNDDEFSQLKAAIQETSRYDQKAKLVHSALRLLLDKKAVQDSLVENEASDKGLLVSYREGISESKIKDLLSPYIEQLLIQDLGSKKIADVKGQPVYGNFYVLDMIAFNSLKNALQNSGIALGISLSPAVAQRTQNLNKVLSSFGVSLDLGATPEEQIKTIDDFLDRGQLDFNVAYWAKGELGMNKALLNQGSL